MGVVHYDIGAFLQETLHHVGSHAPQTYHADLHYPFLPVRTASAARPAGQAGKLFFGWPGRQNNLDMMIPAVIDQCYGRRIPGLPIDRQARGHRSLTLLADNYVIVARTKPDRKSTRLNSSH